MPRTTANLTRMLSCLALIVLLSSCQLFAKPELTVEVGPYLAGGEAQASITISNTGARYSQLSWKAQARNSDLRFEPGSGMLRATESIRIRVGTADGQPIPVDTEIEVTAGSLAQSVKLGGSSAYYCLRDSGNSAPAPSSGPVFAPDQLLVRYQPPPVLLSASVSASFQKLQSASVRSAHQLTLLSAETGNQPELLAVQGDLLEAARQLELDPRVLYAEPNYYLHLLADEDCSEEQWHLSRFGVPEAWRQGEGTSEVVVAVIDSGVDIDHPELEPGMLPGYRFTAAGHSADPRPGNPRSRDSAHGTHVTGIISGLGNNDQGVIGAAPFPAVRVVPIRIFDDEGKQARMSELIQALNWAMGEPVTDIPGVPVNPHPAAIINLSLGMKGPSSNALNEVLARAAERDVLVIAAAGNIPAGTRSQGVYAPANSPFALAVGSVNWDFQRSSFSEHGGASGIALMAPGGSGPSSCRGVLSTMPEGGYGCMQGTSMATPFVSAVAALILTREPQLSALQVQARLLAATYSSGYMDREHYGAGILCAERALVNSNPRPDQPCRLD